MILCEKHNKTVHVAYQREFGRAPSFRQIMHAVGLGSLATVQRYVKALEREGRLNCDSDGKIETVPNLAGGEPTVVPLLGEIACGEPNFAVENIEGSYTFPKDLFGRGELFMLRTFGDSMKDIGIQKGDLIVVRRQNSADDGQVVVALVDGRQDNSAPRKQAYERHRTRRVRHSGRAGELYQAILTLRQNGGLLCVLCA